MKAASSYVITKYSRIICFFLVTLRYRIFFIFFISGFEMFLRQNGSFQSVKNPLKILILTIFLRVALHRQPICNWLVCFKHMQNHQHKKRLSLCLCFYSSQLVCTLEFYSLFLSSQSILSNILVPGWFSHRRLKPEGRDWLRYSQRRWMISSARAQPRDSVSSVRTLVKCASVETTFFICFVTQKPMQFFIFFCHCARVTTPFNSVQWP